VEFSSKPATRQHLSDVFARLREVVTRAGRHLLVAAQGKATSKVAADIKGIAGVKITQATLRKASELVVGNSFDLVLVVAKQATPAVTGLVDAVRRSEHNAATPLILEFAERPSVTDVDKLAERGALALSAAHDHAALLDESTRALHAPLRKLPAEAAATIEKLRRQEPILSNRLVAIVDDDIRNIFSLTSILEEYRVKVVHAENGRDGIALLKARPDIEAMLIDIMMPGLDGYDTIRAIRKLKRFVDLPLIAVTAKAMPEDRVRCFEAGASDYLSKPVEVEELISVLRTCLRRKTS
jgi:CheY-like chemotaxis protein